MTQFCRWPGCNRQVLTDLWGCPEHWFKLPAHIRRQILSTRQLGETSPTSPYVKALDAAKEWIYTRRS